MKSVGHSYFYSCPFKQFFPEESFFRDYIHNPTGLKLIPRKTVVFNLLRILAPDGENIKSILVDSLYQEPTELLMKNEVLKVLDYSTWETIHDRYRLFILLEN